MSEQGLKVLVENIIFYLGSKWLGDCGCTLSKRSQFKEFKAQVELETGRKIKCLRTDNGGEYVDGNFLVSNLERIKLKIKIAIVGPRICSGPSLQHTSSTHIFTDSRRRGDHGVVESTTRCSRRHNNQVSLEVYKRSRDEVKEVENFGTKEGGRQEGKDGSIQEVLLEKKEKEEPNDKPSGFQGSLIPLRLQMAKQVIYYIVGSHSLETTSIIEASVDKRITLSKNYVNFELQKEIRSLDVNGQSTLSQPPLDANGQSAPLQPTLFITLQASARTTSTFTPPTIGVCRYGRHTLVK
ncbi:hypothetical protein CR513_37278, partial [Mucuna pruriens]